MEITASQYRFIWKAINEKVEAAQKAWKEHKDEETLYIVENQYVDAQRALDSFESWYLNQ